MFTENSKNAKMVDEQTSSGSFNVNDAFVQVGNGNLPFGGVGASGYGRYHGKAGFENFSNLKSSLKSKANNMYPSSARFPPFDDSKEKVMRRVLAYGGTTYSGIGKCCLIFWLLAAIIVAAAICIPIVLA